MTKVPQVPLRRAAAPVSLDPEPAALQARSIEEIVNDDDWSTPAKAGVRVNLDTSIKVAALWACVRVLSQGVAQMPVKVRRRIDDGKTKTPRREEVRDHPAYRLLARRPNAWQTGFEFREMMVMFAALCGTGISLKTGDRRNPRELIPILAGQYEVEQQSDFELVYKLKDAKGRTLATVGQEWIFQVRGPSLNGYLGLEPWKVAREALGLAIAAEEAQAKLHSTGYRTPGIISTDNTLTEKQVEQIKKNWREAQAGLANAYKVALLDAGMKFQTLSTTPEDAQALENRRHQVEEICRHMMVFPLMVMQSDKTASFASSEQFFQAHVTHSLDPWAVRFEESARRDLIVEDDIGVRLAREGLLRGVSKDRGAFYRTMIELGIYTRNEVRGFEDLDPLPGLDEPLTPLNMGGAPKDDDDDDDDGDESEGSDDGEET